MEDEADEVGKKDEVDEKDVLPLAPSASASSEMRAEAVMRRSTLVCAVFCSAIPTEMPVLTMTASMAPHWKALAGGAGHVKLPLQRSHTPAVHAAAPE